MKIIIHSKTEASEIPFEITYNTSDEHCVRKFKEMPDVIQLSRCIGLKCESTGDAVNLARMTEQGKDVREFVIC